MLLFLLSVVDDNKRDKVQYLYDKYITLLMSIAKKMLEDEGDNNFENDACDVVQSTFLHLLKYMPDDVNFEKPYVLKVLRNETIKFLKKNKYYDDIDDYEEIASEEDFEDIVVAENNKEILARIIYNLDDKYRLPIVMKYEFEMSVDKIAEQLDLAVPSVYSRLQKAYGLIKKEYEKMEGKNGCVKS